MSFIQKEINCQKMLKKETMMAVVKVVLAMKVETVLKMKMMVMTVIVQLCCTEQRMEQNIRKEKDLE